MRLSPILIWGFIVATALGMPSMFFLFMTVTFGAGKAIWMAMALIALLGPLFILLHAGFLLAARRSKPPVWLTVHLWLAAVLIHIGASVGFTWSGYGGASRGGNNLVETLLLPAAMARAFLERAAS